MKGLAGKSSAAFLACALATSLLVGSPGRRSKPEAQTPTGPNLHLAVAPRHGFRPLTITLTGSLTGVSPDDPEYCHAGVEWEARTPEGRLIVSKEDARCLHPPDQVQVQQTFHKVVTLAETGIFQYRLILHRKNGEKLLSNTQEVRVLSNQ
ncbi:MAG TPA: hypothetical protein VFG76_00235 [Candidatus Polarisedimenticolia bacterium]|nr:hypothetical protein [Candidatus Polarisedimenticolia bacterium]